MNVDDVVAFGGGREQEKQEKISLSLHTLQENRYT